MNQNVFVFLIHICTTIIPQIYPPSKIVLSSLSDVYSLEKEIVNLKWQLYNVQDTFCIQQRHTGTSYLHECLSGLTKLNNNICKYVARWFKNTLDRY